MSFSAILDDAAKAVRVARVSRADIEDRYPDVSLSFRVFDQDTGAAKFKGFVPTHRVCIMTPMRIVVDYVRLLTDDDGVSVVGPDIPSEYMRAVTPQDFESSIVGCDVVNAPTYLYDREADLWWRSKVPHPELSGECQINQVSYEPDCPNLIDRIRRHAPAVRATGAGVYFVQATSGGPIKIGVSQDVQKRLDGIQTYQAEPIFILAMIKDGDVAVERKLHEQFAAHRLRGEWFEPGPVISWLQKQGLII